MTSTPNYVQLPGSTRSPLPGSRQLHAVASNEPIEVSVYLKPRSTDQLTTQINRQSQQRPLLSREELATRYGAHPEDLAKVEAFAHDHDLTIVKVDAARRVVELAGTAAAMREAFQVDLHYYESPEGTYRGRTGELHIPAELAPIVDAVLGLDNRPQARTHFRLLNSDHAAITARAVNTSYTPPQLAQLYNFPNDINGSGECIAIIELGGGYRKKDLRTYFQQLGIPLPKVVSISVDGGRNAPTGDPNSADGEVVLDVEVAGAIAPGAKIAVYFAPNTDRGFVDAVTTAIHDTTNKPSVISISWGAPEVSWTQQAIQAMDQAFQAAAAVGVTVCCASGDDGSNDGVNDGKAHTDFPASSSYALGCGGTQLQANNGTITSEVVWNEASGGATGGGISDVFDLPSWQSGAGVPPSANAGGRKGRGVPDVSGDADPATGYQVLVDGKSFVIGGTSAVAPLWAGLIALLNQKLGHSVGYLNPFLYQKAAPAGAFRDVTSGNNGAYQARAGWDACTGLGSPNGAKLLAALNS
jgi:kumamolisin